MRQPLGQSKADLVERQRRSATGSDQMAPLMTVTSGISDEIIEMRRFEQYIERYEFRRRAPQSGGVGMHVRIIGTAAAAGVANFV
jgi:hypothetical protein